MLIHRMTAAFGRLQNQTLELKGGLNILQAPNETGKSTWCAFLLAMFYGINSRERERAGFIPDKLRYAPWSDTAMSGRLDCLAGGQELTITRSTRRQTAPMGEFQAVYTGTGDQVPALTGQNCGETLLGVSREVFERSAFIRQSGLAISQDAGLERRIAALITSGEEETSYSEAADVLKKQLNRRRHNKTGQIPALETERREAEESLLQSDHLARQLTEANIRAEALSTREGTLIQELAQHDRWDAFVRKKALTEAEDAAHQAKQAADTLRQRIEEEHVPENDTIGRLRGAIVNLEATRSAMSIARDQRDEAAKALLRAEAAVNESPFAGQTVEQARQDAEKAYAVHESLLLWVGILMGGAMLMLFSYGAFLRPLFAAAGWRDQGEVLALLAAFAVLALAAWLRRRHVLKKKNAALCKRFGTAEASELLALVDAYADALSVRDTAQAEADRRSAAAETLYATLSSNEQGILLEVRRFAPAAFDILTADSLLRACAVRRKELAAAEAAAQEAKLRYELLAQQTPIPIEANLEEPAPPVRSREAVSAELAEVRAELTAVNSAADQLTGRLHATGDPVVLRSTAEQLTEELHRLENEHAAIQLAITALEDANTSLQNRFSPELGRRAAEIFGELTENRYGGVVLDRSFHLFAEPQGGPVFRDAALLSAGAADQLYLAARLAICDLVLPSENAVPMVLDDALANFDDQRCAAALRWLKKEAETRQILLFTCHSREADFFAGDGEVFIQQLTDAPKGV